MSEKVDIVVHVEGEGAEQIDKVNSSLDHLEESTDKATTATEKHTESNSGFNTSLNKLYPSLQTINPMMAQFGMSALLSAGLLAGVGVESLKFSQTLHDLVGGINDVGITAQTSGVNGFDSFGESLSTVTDLSDKLGIPLADVAKSLTALLPVTRDMGIAESILASAVKDHQESGQNLDDVLNRLIGAYNGTLPIYDQTTGKLLLGLDAVKALNKAYDDNSNAAVDLQTKYSDFASKGLEQVISGLGIVGTLLKDIAMAPVAIPEWLNSLAGADIAKYKTLGDAANAGVMGVSGTGTPSMTPAPILTAGNNRPSVPYGQYDPYSDPNSPQYIPPGGGAGGYNPTTGINAYGGPMGTMGGFGPGLDQYGNPIASIEGFDTAGSGLSSDSPSGRGLLMESYDVGTDYVPKTGPALLHQGEAVVPKEQNQGGQGGPTTIQLYLNDGTQLAQWVMAQIDTAVRLRGGF